jgi:hypothetical protein
MNKLIIIGFVLFSNVQIAKAQGCSDAGVCSMHSLKPNNTKIADTKKSQLAIGVGYGKADYNISVFSNYIDYKININNKVSFGAKINTVAQSGNGISKFGLGDILGNVDVAISNKSRLIIGAKLPLTNANQQQNNLSLPMDYQSSLGTVDGIIGVNTSVQKLQLMLAYQQPLAQNSNNFFSNLHAPNSILSKFQTTNGYNRKADLISRIAFPIQATNALQITPGLLGIYHVANDTYIDFVQMKQTINGSKGLTLNTNLFFDYKINQNNAIQLNLGAPLVVRTTRPDGLTRSVVANLEYRFRF